MSVIKVDSNAINNLITNPKKRKLVYSIYAVLGLVIGSIQVGFQTAGLKDVPWFEITTAVYIYLSVPFGVLAFVNAPGEKDIEETVDIEAMNDNNFFFDEGGNKVYDLDEYSDDVKKRSPKH